MIACQLLTSATTFVGSLGTVATSTLFEAALCAQNHTLFLAMTVNV